MEEEIIKNSQTLAQAIREIFGFDNGTTRRKMKKIIEDKNIDTSHLRYKPLIHKRIIKNCPICDKKFETMVNHKNEKTTCSYSCANTYFRSGENNPNWKVESFGLFSKKYRTLCFMKHKKECIICGEDKIVSVHHYDGNHNNNSFDNLIPLCPTHHQYVHSKYKCEIIHIIDDYRNDFIKKHKQVLTSSPSREVHSKNKNGESDDYRNDKYQRRDQKID